MAPRASSRTRQSPAPSTPRSARKGRARTPSMAQRNLPLVHANELLSSARVKIHPVKKQTLTLEHEQILIYRQKVPTPKGVSGHLIRRTDTDAVSASSLFRCAFPTASTKQEEDEMEYLVSKFDTVAAGREDEPDGRGRLTGKWIPTADATGLAEEYGLLKFASDLFAYTGSDELNSTADSPTDDTPAKTDATEPSVQDTPPARASKRQRLQSPSAATSGVTIEQRISTDPATGAAVETTTVSIETPVDAEAGQAVSQEQKSLEAIASAKELVESLKEQQVLANVDASTSGKKRTIDEVGKDDPTMRKKTWFGRSAARPIAGTVAASQAANPAQSRRLLAFAGLAIVGAATAAAPYFL